MQQEFSHPHSVTFFSYENILFFHHSLWNFTQSISLSLGIPLTNLLSPALTFNPMQSRTIILNEMLRSFCICSPFWIANFLKRISLIGTGFRTTKREPRIGPHNLEGSNLVFLQLCPISWGEESVGPRGLPTQNLHSLLYTLDHREPVERALHLHWGPAWSYSPSPSFWGQMMIPTCTHKPKE